MKKLLFPLAIAGMLGMASCSEDFEVSAPYKQVTVVYAMLNPKDTAHYIRVQKAFLDEKKSAIDMGKISDSSFYREGEIDVILEEYRNSTSSATVYPLTRVSMEQEGYFKEASGSAQGFFTSPHYAYKTKHTLNSSYTYNVKVINKLSGETIETVPSSPNGKGIGMVSTSEAQGDGNAFRIDAFFNDDYFLDFERSTSAYNYRLVGNTPANGVLIEGVLRFHWVDKNTVTGAQVDRTADYLFADTIGQERFILTVPNQNIYSFLAEAMGPAPANVERYMDSCDILVWAGSNELYKYQQVSQAQGGGITGDQIKPNYTNLKGSKYVLGLVASRTYVMKRNIPLGREGGTHGGAPANYTIDSLRTNPITSALNIRGRSDR